MQFNIARTLKDLFEGNHHSTPQAPWERDWKVVSSLHISLPEGREEKLCSLFLRLNSLFEAGIYIQTCGGKNKKRLRQALCFFRGEVKTASDEEFFSDLDPLPLHQVQKTDGAKWKNLFKPYFKNNLDDVSVYRVQLSENTFILLADTLPDPWMKKLLSDVHERILRGIP